MEPLHVAALVIFVLLFSSAAALELIGAWRFIGYLRNLARRRPPNSPGS